MSPSDGSNSKFGSSHRSGSSFHIPLIKSSSGLVSIGGPKKKSIKSPSSSVELRLVIRPKFGKAHPFESDHTFSNIYIYINYIHPEPRTSSSIVVFVQGKEAGPLLRRERAVRETAGARASSEESTMGQCRGKWLPRLGSSCRRCFSAPRFRRFSLLNSLAQFHTSG